MPAIPDKQGDGRSSLRDDGYLFSKRHRDNAFRIEAEMLVAFARQMLYEPD
jgi:hypothetical protein